MGNFDSGIGVGWLGGIFCWETFVRGIGVGRWVVLTGWMVLVEMILSAVLWPFWLAVAAGIVLATAMVLQAAEMVLAAVVAPVVDVGVLSLNAEKN